MNALLVDVDPARNPVEWLEWRQEGIGASDIAAIVGLSPWGSPWTVWADKVRLLPPQSPTEVMEAGHWLELAIAPWFEDRTGLPCTGVQTALMEPDLPWMRCTVDGFVGDPAAPDGLLEIKTERFGKRWDVIPVHHQAQAQWQMAVTGLEQVWFAVLHGRRLEVYELARDPADIGVLIQAADRFWHLNVLEHEPPPVDGSTATATALAAVWPAETPGKTAPLDNVRGVLAEWAHARETKAAAEREEREAANLIKAALADAEEGTVNGRRVVTWRAQQRSTVCARCGHRATSEPFRVLRTR